MCYTGQGMKINKNTQEIHGRKIRVGEINEQRYKKECDTASHIGGYVVLAALA